MRQASLHVQCTAMGLAKHRDPVGPRRWSLARHFTRAWARGWGCGGSVLHGHVWRGHCVCVHCPAPSHVLPLLCVSVPHMSCCQINKGETGWALVDRHNFYMERGLSIGQWIMSLEPDAVVVEWGVNDHFWGYQVRAPKRTPMCVFSPGVTGAAAVYNGRDRVTDDVVRFLHMTLVTGAAHPCAEANLKAIPQWPKNGPVFQLVRTGASIGVCTGAVARLVMSVHTSFRVVQ